MSFRVEKPEPIPLETATVAQAAFPKGSTVMSLRDELGILYKDKQFRSLFPSRQGQPAWSAWRLALITVMQYIEDLTDAQTAQAVRGRIDWKYALSLSLSDPGIDSSVLSEFRSRLVKAKAEEMLLEKLLERCQNRGWLSGAGVQRSDSTHVLAAIRVMHRLEVVGETLRAALNSLAVAVPQWLQETVPVEWFESYSSRIEEYHLPKEKEQRQQLGASIGRNGHELLAAVYNQAVDWLSQLPAVEALRQVWVQQFYLDTQGQVHWRQPNDSPPSAQLIHSPYDVEARYSRKRETQWVGYKVHLSETCGENAPHLITHVHTTQATTADVEVTEPIHQALQQRQLLPDTHIVDTGYVSAEQLCQAQETAGVELLAPVLPDSSWQAIANQGFDLTHFAIDWENHQAQCPAGQMSQTWKPTSDRRGQEVIQVRFPTSICRTCSHRPSCTQTQKQGRTITLRPQAQHLALQQARHRQTTDSFRRCYAQRAGIEGTLAQGIRAFGLRRCRYIGRTKTHLQHVITATAINIVRLLNWLHGVPISATRCSHFAALNPQLQPL